MGELDALEQQIGDSLKIKEKVCVRTFLKIKSSFTYAQSWNANGNRIDDDVPPSAESGDEEGQEDQEYQPDHKPQRILHDG